MNNQTTYNNITNLLKSRDWKKERHTSKFDIFSPPQILGIEDSYNLYIYNKIENKDYESSIIRSLDVLTQIYDEDIDELCSIIIEDKQILSLHIKADDVENGRPNIPFFNNLLSNSKELLEQIANFSVVQKQHFFHKSEEAERYLNYCKFIKNDVGSLITKIQLPNNEDIKAKNLFDDGLKGSQVNQKLMDVTKFVNDEIIAKENFQPDDAFLIKHKQNISVNVSDKIKNLYKGIEYSDIDISLKSVISDQTITAKELNKEKVDNLGNFSKLIREKIKEISENYITIKGKIFQLNSKNIDSDKNTILLESVIDNVKNKVSVKLNSKDYKSAVEAHKNNRDVVMECKIEKEKTQYKVIELDKFELSQ